ncbi:MAG: glycosyltransferase family 9 protein [Candidatus Margulisbacteria bacterium]|nr:glycosyltransferase family 9 protein [Candidatus Margulisiibacteriota bacterium]
MANYRIRHFKWIMWVSILDGVGKYVFFWKKWIRKPKNLNRVLVIKLTDLGQALPVFPFVKHLKETNPDVEIDVLVTPDVCEVFQQFETVSHVNEMYAFNSRKGRRGFHFLERLKMIFKLRKSKYDMIFDLCADVRASLFTSLLGGKYCVGFNDGGGGFLQHHCVTPDQNWDFITRDLSVLSVFESQSYPSNLLSDLFFPVTDRSRCVIDHFLNRKHIKPHKYAVVHSGNNEDERILTVVDIKRALKASDWDKRHPILLVGTELDKPRLTMLAKQMQPDWSVEVVMTKSLHHLAALMNTSKLVISSDSGPMHLAGFLGVTVIPIYKDLGNKQINHKQIWFPYEETVDITAA